MIGATKRPLKIGLRFVCLIAVFLSSSVWSENFRHLSEFPPLGLDLDSAKVMPTGFKRIVGTSHKGIKYEDSIYMEVNCDEDSVRVVSSKGKSSWVFPQPPNGFVCYGLACLAVNYSCNSQFKEMFDAIGLTPDEAYMLANMNYFAKKSFNKNPELFDKNNDGKLSDSEMMGAPPSVIKMFVDDAKNSIDLDGDGVLDLSEHKTQFFKVLNNIKAGK